MPPSALPPGTRFLDLDDASEWSYSWHWQHRSALTSLAGRLWRDDVGHQKRQRCGLGRYFALAVLARGSVVPQQNGLARFASGRRR
jgi:hypothetical protein